MRAFIPAARRSALWGGLVSLILHGSVVALSYLPGLLPSLLPKAPITMDIVPEAKVALPSASPPDAKEDPKADPKPNDASGGIAQPKPKPKPRRPTLPTIANLGGVEQEGASVLVALRMVPLRSSPHRQVLRDLLVALPDTRFLVLGTTLSAEKLADALIDDFQTLLITTTDPRRIITTAALLIPSDQAAASRVPALFAALAQRRVAPWELRHLSALSPTLYAYAQDEVLSLWRTMVETPNSAARLRGLGGKSAALVAEIRDIHRLVRLRDGLPTPQRLRLALDAQPNPGLRLEITLQNEADARLLEEQLPALKERFIDRFSWVGLGDLFADLKVKRTGDQVFIEGHLPKSDVHLIANYAQLFLGRIPVDSPPPAPPTQPQPDLASPQPDQASPQP